ncbi:MAG: 23S rRNA (uracil(1939)-C(5))-methyltransferase RlmD [bacterium]|nr:23S rRNA (uracil(1939)-C(5))-methyltransferase RlmD [bacterium]
MKKEILKAIVTATDLNSKGQAVFRYDGRVGFVDGLLPGETAEVNLTRKQDLWLGILQKRITHSPLRCQHPCSHSNLCFASPLGWLKPYAQKEYKQNSAYQVLKRIANLEWEKFHYIESNQYWNYRNKVEFSVKVVNENKVVCGYHSTQQPHQIIPIRNCLLADETINQFWSEFNERKDVQQFLKKCHRILIRAGNGIHFHFFLNEPLDFKDNAFLTNFFNNSIGLNGITTSIQNENRVKIFKGELRLQGYDGIRIHPFTFRQVNDSIAKALQQRVKNECISVQGEIWDLYGGFGFLSYPLANENRIIKVFEHNRFAIEDGKKIKSNHSIEFVTMDISKQWNTFPSKSKPIVVIMDPPYAGAGLEVCKKIVSLRPQKIIYISCHGAALARDIKIFMNGNYHIKDITLLDMFPQTMDIEWFVVLEKY